MACFASGPSCNPNEVDFIDTELAGVDELYAAMDNLVLNNYDAEPICVETLLQVQLNHLCCAKTLRKHNNGELVFEVNNDGVLLRSGNEYVQIVSRHSFKDRILRISQQCLLGGHPSGRRLYRRVRMNFYWHALAVDWYRTVRERLHCAHTKSISARTPWDSNFSLHLQNWS